MSKIIELPKQRYVNMARNKRKVICMARRIDGKGCQGCAFCGIDNLCIQPEKILHMRELFCKEPRKFWNGTDFGSK